jgi:signal transduction histidine kinase
VEERTTQLRSLAHELSLVEEKQRRKIATYLHDDIAQALALATVRLELLRDMVSKRNIKKELEAVKEIIDQTTARTRSLTFEISPPILYDSGFEPAVEWLAEQFQNQHDIVCELKNDGLPKPVSSDLKVILFQSVRELLTNVAKHAQARSVRVLTLREGNSIRIEVKDDGVGFNPKILNQKITKNEGFGLFNLKERLRHLRGKLEVSSTVGQGTSVTIMAPLKSSRRGVNRKKE